MVRKMKRKTRTFDLEYFLADRFLSPMVGAHVNLSVKSLVGWKQCYRGTYDLPFNGSVLMNRCKGKRLLVACRSDADRKTLTVAGVSRREELLRTCSFTGGRSRSERR